MAEGGDGERREWEDRAALTGQGGALSLTPCKRFRLMRGLSQVVVAGAARVSITAVRKLEEGRVAGMQIRTLVRIAEALGVPPLDLVPGLARRTGANRPPIDAPHIRRREPIARRRACERWLVELLREGAVPFHEIETAAAERGWTKLFLLRRRKVLGILSRERVVRDPDGKRRWEWVLPEALQSAPGATH